jgi:glycosyltransferase involved in cell wall biosynthesis
VADTREAFASGVATLATDPERRAALAEAALAHAARQFDWRALGEKQRDLLRSML